MQSDAGSSDARSSSVKRRLATILMADEAATKRAADAERTAVATRASKGDAENRGATQIAAASRSSAGGEAAAATGVDRFDGAYQGRICSVNPDGSPRCWRVLLSVSHGTLSATWLSRFNNEPSHAKGTISADGAVTLALDGRAPNGHALTGGMNGSLADNKIAASGAWSNNAPINATWSLSR